MNFAAELFFTAIGMIFFIVTVAEIGCKLITHFRKEKEEASNGSN